MEAITPELWFLAPLAMHGFAFLMGTFVLPQEREVLFVGSLIVGALVWIIGVWHTSVQSVMILDSSIGPTLLSGPNELTALGGATFFFLLIVTALLYAGSGLAVMVCTAEFTDGYRANRSQA